MVLSAVSGPLIKHESPCIPVSFLKKKNKPLHVVLFLVSTLIAGTWNARSPRTKSWLGRKTRLKGRSSALSALNIELQTALVNAFPDWAFALYGAECARPLMLLRVAPWHGRVRHLKTKSEEALNGRGKGGEKGDYLPAILVYF